MNINIFFLLIVAGLSMIFFLFKPLNIKEQKFDDIPLFELEKFKLIELSNSGLTTILDGAKGIKYSDRYEILHVDYTDNSKKYLANMKANNGLYKGDTINLNGDVVYSREDGLSFKTQKATYSKKTNIAKSTTNYVSYLGNNKIEGSYIEYNNLTKVIKSKNIKANYQLNN
ncbi:LPS export ABC transporter periplasmic protein LptC [Sulfurimonas sp.]